MCLLWSTRLLLLALLRRSIATHDLLCRYILNSLWLVATSSTTLLCASHMHGLRSMGWSCSLPSYWRTTASGSCITPCAKYLDHLLVSSGSTSWPASLRCPFFRLLHLFRQPRAASAPSIPAGPILYSKIIIIIIYIDDGNEEASSLNAERDGFN